MLAVLMMGAVLSGTPAWAQDQQSPPEQPSPAQPSTPADANAAPKAVDPKAAAEAAEDLTMNRTLAEGAQLMHTGQVRPAIDDFDKVIAVYEARYKDSKDTLYCATDAAEALAYLTLAAAERHGARIVPGAWAAAYFLKGYSQVEMRDIAAAKGNLERARNMSPFNAHYLNELANLYKSEKNWPLALETYQQAKALSASTQPPLDKNKEEAVAQHGIAFVYSETGKLDDAEAIYKACLEKNPQDVYAQHELAYVQQQKAKQPHFQ